MTQIDKFDPGKPEVQACLARIKTAAPIKNLTDEEVLTTLRLLQLQALLTEGRYGQIVVHCQDKRLELCDDNDRLLAMLTDCHLRGVLLGTKRCRSLFGGTVYHWRSIARKCPVTDTVSVISENGEGYYGRGWVIADHINALRGWIIDHATNPDIKSLKK